MRLTGCLLHKEGLCWNRFYAMFLVLKDSKFWGLLGSLSSARFSVLPDMNKTSLPQQTRSKIRKHENKI